jgi:hypothetical protein
MTGSLAQPTFAYKQYRVNERKKLSPNHAHFTKRGSAQALPTLVTWRLHSRYQSMVFAHLRLTFVMSGRAAALAAKFNGVLKTTRRVGFTPLRMEP